MCGDVSIHASISAFHGEPSPSPRAQSKKKERDLCFKDCGGWCKKEPALFRTDTEKGSEAKGQEFGIRRSVVVCCGEF